MVAATWWALLRQLRQPARRVRAAGLLLGLGMLSKYSFALFAAVLGGALLSLPAGRALLRERGAWWLPVVVALLVVLPHGLWLLEHWQAASGPPPWQAAVRWRPAPGGARRAEPGQAVLSNLLLLPCWRWWRFAAAGGGPRPASHRRSQPGSPFRRVSCPCLAAICCCWRWRSRAGRCGRCHAHQGRWLYLLLCTVPLMAFAWRPGLAGIGAAKVFGGMLLGMAVLVWLALSLRVWANGQRGAPDELNEPVAALAGALRAASYDGRSPIVAGDPCWPGSCGCSFCRRRYPCAGARPAGHAPNGSRPQAHAQWRCCAAGRPAMAAGGARRSTAAVRLVAHVHAA